MLSDVAGQAQRRLAKPLKHCFDWLLFVKPEKKRSFKCSTRPLSAIVITPNYRVFLSRAIPAISDNNVTIQHIKI